MSLSSYIGLFIFIFSFIPGWALALEMPGEVYFREDSFISPDYTATSDKSFSFIGARFNNLDDFESATKVDVSGVFSPETPLLSYLNVSQLNYQIGSLTLGRMKQHWSLLDEQWQLGFIQPQFKWNPLVPESQGLTGFFYDLNNADKNSPIGMHLFASFLYLPDQGPSYQIDNGQFVSVNPWFPNLPSAVQIDTAGQVVNKINWDLQKPEASAVIFNPSYVGQLYLGNENQGLYLSTSLAYKPSNQFMMGVDLNVPPNPTINVMVRPTIYYHNVATLDARYSFESVYFGIGALQERPNAPELQPDLTYRIFGESDLVSPYIGFHSMSFDVLLSYLGIQQSPDQFVGPMSNNQMVSVLPTRLAYKDAERAELSYRLPIAKNQSLKIKTSYLQGVSDDFALWVTSLDYQVDRQWKVSSSMIFVRANDQATTAPLFQQYANNDAFTMGVNYVF